MVGNLSGRKLLDDDLGKTQSEAVNWLPRSRLRSGGRGDFLMNALTVATVCVLAAAAGFAAWSRHGDDSAPAASAASRPPERLTVARAPAAPTAPVAPTPAVAPAPAVAPVRNVVTAPSASPLPPASIVAGAESTGAPRASASAPPVSIEPRVETVPPSEAPPRPVAPAPLTNFSAGSFESLPPLAGVADWAPPPPAPTPSPAAPPASPSRPDPTPPRDLSGAARSQQAPPAANQPTPVAPTPQRAAALTPPPAAGAKVSIYLDEYPDQKSAAAALSQKSSAYGRAIGSGGKLTYTRRNGDAWRLRVGNLDRSAAEAMCARLKSAGAPCSIGPN